MIRALAVALLSTVSSAALAQSEEGEAGDVSAVDREAGPLKDRIRPVSGHLFLKQGRFELSPSASITVRDSFFTKLVFGGSITYHLAESLGLGLRGAYSLPLVAGTAQICEVNAQNQRVCRAPDPRDLDGRAPGQITLLAGADLQWAPIYGKISVLAEQFLHFDIYAIAGGAFVQYRGPPLEAGGAPASRYSPGLNAGVGMRFFLNRWLTVRGELRDLIYVEYVGNSDTGTDITSLRNQLIFELGLSLFFPTTFGET
jgi:outer membrane beta-barrel protein